MIKVLLRHHIERIAALGYNDQTYKGLMNCHVEGVHSVVLHDETQNRLRLFYATKSHQLWRNSYPHAWNMALAVHPHHCKVWLTQIFGHIENQKFLMAPDETGPYHLCEYVSGVLKEEGKLIDTGKRYRAESMVLEKIGPTGVEMRASERHSIYVPRGHEAAWFVLEGQEDKDYKSVCYTTNPQFSPTLLYRKMDPIQICGMLHEIAEGIPK